MLGDDHRDTLRSMNNMGFLLQSQGKHEEAEPYFREALEGSRRVLGDDHPETLRAINNTGHASFGFSLIFYFSLLGYVYRSNLKDHALIIPAIWLLSPIIIAFSNYARPEALIFALLGLFLSAINFNRYTRRRKFADAVFLSSVEYGGEIRRHVATRQRQGRHNEQLSRLF